MMEIVLATTNKGKLKEFNEMGKEIGIKFISIDMPEIEENGKTFEENSLIKAKAIMKLCNKPVVADDSGLCVYALDEGPGIYTSRFANHLDTYEKRCEYLIKKIDEKKQDRRAYFVCVITLIYPDGKYYHFKAKAEGEITKKLSGKNGHGYDPVFYSYDLQKTFANATIEEKDSVSHRGKAFKKLKEFLNGKI